MRGRFLTRTSSTIMLAFAGALAMATLARAAAPQVPFQPSLNVVVIPPRSTRSESPGMPMPAIL